MLPRLQSQGPPPPSHLRSGAGAATHLRSLPPRSRRHRRRPPALSCAAPCPSGVTDRVRLSSRLAGTSRFRGECSRGGTAAPPPHFRCAAEPAAVLPAPEATANVNGPGGDGLGGRARPQQRRGRRRIRGGCQIESRIVRFHQGLTAPETETLSA